MTSHDIRRNDAAGLERWVESCLAARAPETGWQPNLAQALARLQDRRNAERNRQRRWRWMAASALAACLPVMAFPVTRALAERCVSACVEESNKVRRFFLGDTPSSALRETYIQPGARKMAPDFTLNNASGRPIRLSDSRGKVVLLNFWATWCPPCKTEIPWFMDFQRTYGSRGFTVLGVSLDEDGWTSVKPYIEEKQVNYNVMIGSRDVTRLYGGLDSVPTTLIVDPSGRMAAIHVGISARSEYEADIQAVLNER